MSPTTPKHLLALAAAGIVGASLAYSPVSQAFKFGDMMNPGKWMGGGRDRYDGDYYDEGPYGGAYGGPYGGPYSGYGPGPYGGGPYGPPGPYGAPGYRGAPPPAAPAAPPAPAAPAAKAPSPPAASSSEIDALKRRIEELESQQQPAPPPPSDWGSAPPASSSDWGSAPAFRPMGKY